MATTLDRVEEFDDHFEIYYKDVENPLMIDKEDFHHWYAFQNKWSYQKLYNRLFVTCQNRRHYYRHYYLHRMIVGCTGNEIVDHIDGNGMNNRRSNLRICNTQENSFNRKKIAGCSSRFKGVYFHRNAKKWIANIKEGGKTKALGSFSLEEDAAKVYDEAAKRLHGSFAKLNFN